MKQNQNKNSVNNTAFLFNQMFKMTHTESRTLRLRHVGCWTAMLISAQTFLSPEMLLFERRRWLGALCAIVGHNGTLHLTEVGLVVMS